MALRATARSQEIHASRESAIITRFSGTYAQEQFCRKRGYPLLSYFSIIWSEDWKEARGIETKLSGQYLAGRGIQAVHEALEGRAQAAVAENWPAIVAVAQALLAKDPEPVKLLNSGGGGRIPRVRNR